MLTDSVTQSFTAIYTKDLKLKEKQTCHSLNVKLDSSTESLTVIYSKGLKLYLKHIPSQTPSLLFLVKTWRFTKIRLLRDFKNISEANYKDRWIVLLKQCSCLFCQLWTNFCLLGYFQKPKLTEILKNNLIYTFRNFQGNIWGSSFIVMQLSVLFVVKTLNFTRRKSSVDITLQKQTLTDVSKIDGFKCFAKLLYRRLYIMKIQASSL